MTDSWRHRWFPGLIQLPENSILMFGAYGNGNLGDKYQALSLGRHLEEAWTATPLFTTSIFPKPYPVSDHANRLPARAILSPQLINQARALIIGGGGLLASRHKPLDSRSWLRRISVPIFLLGIGASPRTLEAHRPLVEKATYVSARDAFSCEVLSGIRSDVEFLPDPILADRELVPIASHAAIGGRGICWILRKPNARKARLYRRIRDSLAPEDQVIGIFPSTDQAAGLSRIFGRRIRFSNDLPELIPLLRSAAVVVSNRYHGCIISSRLGLPTMASDHQGEGSKVYRLARQLGFPEPDFKLRPGREIDRKAILAYARPFRESFPAIAQSIRDLEALFTRSLTLLHR